MKWLYLHQYTNSTSLDSDMEGMIFVERERERERERETDPAYANGLS